MNPIFISYNTAMKPVHGALIKLPTVLYMILQLAILHNTHWYILGKNYIIFTFDIHTYIHTHFMLFNMQKTNPNTFFIL